LLPEEESPLLRQIRNPDSHHLTLNPRVYNSWLYMLWVYLPSCV